ncbi:MAG: acyltransferase [Methanobrevibacter sp.]|nr:acyltransferase [Methanobrevibacter sp.]
MNSNKRIFYYDFLRAIAIILVILVHVDGIIGYGFDSLKHAIPGLLTATTWPAVPIFLMLSGALLLNRSYTLSEFFKKRFTRILYPFIFWVLVTGLIGFLSFSWSGEETLKVIFGLISPFWYIWMLIGIYLFIPIINSFLKEYGLRGFEFFLLVWAVTILLVTIKIPLLGGINLHYFAGYMGFVVLGYYLDNKQFNLSDRSMFYAGFLLLILSTVFRMYVFRFELDLYSDYNLLFTTIAQSVGLFLTVRYLDKIAIENDNIYSKIKNNIVGKAILSISLCSYGMYLVHYIIIECFVFLNIYSLKLLPVILIITVLDSWVIIFTFSKIPYLKKVSGVT